MRSPSCRSEEFDDVEINRQCENVDHHLAVRVDPRQVDRPLDLVGDAGDQREQFAEIGVIRAARCRESKNWVCISKLQPVVPNFGRRKCRTSIDVRKGPIGTSQAEEIPGNVGLGRFKRPA